jgi:hypothetical protein
MQKPSGASLRSVGPATALGRRDRRTAALRDEFHEFDWHQLAAASTVRSVKVYRQHQCGKRHRTYTAFAKCAWKKKGILLQVFGEGEYASVSRCCDSYNIPSYRRTITVYLYESAEAAQQAKALIDSTACGGLCRKLHEVVRVEPVPCQNSRIGL